MTTTTTVEHMATVDQALLGWRVDDAHLEGYFLKIAGWVAARAGPVREIEVLYDGLLVTRVPVALARPDVTRALHRSDDSEPTGFEVTCSVIALPEEFVLTMCARVGSSPIVPFAVVRGTHGPLRTGFHPQLNPLSVTSLGRTGTTLLMGTLAAHPEIVVHRVFPYEARIAAYWLHALTILAGPALHSESSHPDTFLIQPFFIGHNPYSSADHAPGAALQRWLRGPAVEATAAFCQRSIEASYLQIAADQGQESARFFAEKSIPTHVPRLLWQTYAGTREIVLVRDLRDVICSMTAFDAKRSSASFQGADSNLETLVVRLVGDYRRLAEAWQQRRDSAMLLRYEDLVGDPATWLRQVADYLGVDSGPATIRRLISAGRVASLVTEAHRTSADSSRSVGRYRRDMDAGARGLCEELGGSTLTAFGYTI